MAKPDVQNSKQDNNGQSTTPRQELQNIAAEAAVKGLTAITNRMQEDLDRWKGKG